MSRVTVTNLAKSFAGRPVLRGVNLDIADGEVVALLGSSGCGKTTMLRILAGFLEPDEGTVSFDGTPVAGSGVSVPPQHRKVGYVPQEGALFPHLDVRGNILFGLPRKERTAARLREMLDLAELPEKVARQYPHELSGGQQQRVALARALAPRPRVVLLDEPFSSLDASLRISAGREVTRLLRATGTTAVLVTHDQGEALSLADRVAVMRQGQIAQVDAPVNLYRTPADVEVASFVGGATALPAVLHDARVRCALGELAVAPDLPAAASTDGDVTVIVRPEQIRLSASLNGGPTALVEEVAFYGPYATVRLDMEGVGPVLARVEPSAVPQLGARVALEVVGVVVVYR